MTTQIPGTVLIDRYTCSLMLANYICFNCSLRKKKIQKLLFLRHEI